MRRTHDFYETPPWQTHALLARVKIQRPALEPCAGDKSLADVLSQAIGEAVHCNDIVPKRKADTHLDATLGSHWQNLPRAAWVVTNPPFNCAMAILHHAYEHAREGVAMLLRISFLEPTEKRGNRGEWLAAHPPDRLIVLPRHSYTANGKTDNVTTAWFVWHKDKLRSNTHSIDFVTKNERDTLAGNHAR